MVRFRTLLAIPTLAFVITGISFSSPFWIEVDISSLAGSDFELEIDLYDNNGIIGDSWAFIDNVFIKDSSGVIELIDFEDDTLQDFDDSLNPASVNVVSGTWWSGNYMMRIDEDPTCTPTITYRDFSSSSATKLLHMEFEFISSGVSGFFGQDALVASLLDPTTHDPLITGLTGSGDFLEATASGNSTSSEVRGIDPIPEPNTILLVLSGLSGVLAYGKVRFRRHRR